MDIDFSAVKAFTEEVLLKKIKKKKLMHKNTFDVENFKHIVNLKVIHNLISNKVIVEPLIYKGGRFNFWKLKGSVFP